jgi:hypothetical protein
MQKQIIHRFDRHGVLLKRILWWAANAGICGKFRFDRFDLSSFVWNPQSQGALAGHIKRGDSLRPT